MEWLFQAQLYQKENNSIWTCWKVISKLPYQSKNFNSLLKHSCISYVKHSKQIENVENHLINVPVDNTIFLQISHSSCKILRNTVKHPKPIWKWPILFITHKTHQSKSPPLPTSLAPEPQFLKNYPIITTYKHLHSPNFQLINTLLKQTLKYFSSNVVKMQSLALNQLKNQSFLQINQSTNPSFTKAFQTFKTGEKDSSFKEYLFHQIIFKKPRWISFQFSTPKPQKIIYKFLEIKGRSSKLEGFFTTNEESKWQNYKNKEQRNEGRKRDKYIYRLCMYRGIYKSVNDS